MGTVQPYIIRQGDYLSKLAASRGFDPKEVWEHDSNKDLRGLRQNPEVLCPGDVLRVPTRSPPSVPLRLQTQNAFSAEVPKIELHIVVKGSDDRPRVNARYKVYGAQADALEGTTDGEGVATFKLAVTVESIQIVFEKDESAYHFHVGHLDPADQATGVRQRLEHLGYYEERLGARDAEERLKEAIRNFQTQERLTVTGVADEETQARLCQVHGC